MTHLSDLVQLLARPRHGYDRPVRALFCIPELALNGAVTSLLEQVRHMRAQSDSITVLTPQLIGPARALMTAFQETGAEVVHTANSGQHDVAVGCTVYSARYLQLLVERMPTVWWIHEGRLGLNTMLGRPENIETLTRVGKLIFPSWGAVERLWSPLLGNLPPGRIEVIPPRVPRPAPGPAMTRGTGLSRIVCVGTLYRRKRQVDLIRAVAALHGAAIQCVLIGEGVQLDEPADKIIAADPERFVLTGGLQPDDVQAWYRSSDIFCLPSEDECMPIAPIEAAWHELPVVLADLACYEGVWHHGFNALIHPVGDYEMLAWYLRMLIESASLRARFAKAGGALALRFDGQRFGTMFDSVLQEAIATFC